MAKDPPSRDDANFIANLARRRKELGLNQSDVARKMMDMGWSYFTQSTVSRLEKGERPLRLGEARALSAVLGETLSAMLSVPEHRAVLNHLWGAERDASRAIDELWSASHEVHKAHSRLDAVVKRARDVDLSEVEDDDVRSRIRAELGAAEQTLKSTKSAVEEMSVETISSFDFSQMEGEDDGVDQEAS